MNLLVTGGAGFIGCNFVKYILKTEKDIKLVNLDALTYAGNLLSLEEVESDPRYKFIEADIRHKDLVSQIIAEEEIDVIVNFAAESHVDNSILHPEIFIETNIMGTHNMLQGAKAYWQIGKDDQGYPIYRDNVKFLQVSTDEVYGSLGKEGLFTETTSIKPNSPYSASKASADLLVRSFSQTYNFPCNITRCSNNYGPYQYPEKLIPLMIRNVISEKSLPIYGDGMQIRDWLYVEDHCSALWQVVKKGELGEVYNIGGNNEKANIEIVKIILKELDGDEALLTYVEDRLGHDRRYAIDNHKITSKLDWKPAYSFEEGIKKTIKWYYENITWVESVSDNR